MKGYLAFTLALFLTCHVTFGLEVVNLTIADGNIQGLVNTTYRNNVTYYNFRGIPYAQPPVDDLRFAAPVKNDAWNGIYDATYDRSSCLQTSTNNFLTYTTVGDEDCLYINVYTPDLSGNASVVVWIHGGAFMTGNSSYEICGPDNFMDQGIVFVSFNYRLGVFGFLSTEDEACPGNWGIKDQILALKWVQENIAYFGGDPNNVTIFGQSAGSVAVHILLQTPLAEGLFKGAIMNSGTSLNLWSLNTRASTTSSLLATALRVVSFGNSTALVKGLRKIDTDTLIQSAYSVSIGLFITNGLRGLPWGPVIELDVDGAVLINPSDDALNQGNFTKVPVLMGLNSNEAGSADPLTAILRFFLLYYDVYTTVFSPYSMTTNAITKLVVGYTVRLHYFGALAVTSSPGSLANFLSADQFNRPIRRAAADMSNYTTVYFYEFGHQGNISGVTDREYDGVGHAEDLNYFFRSSNNATDTDLRVSENMILLWSNFIKYGNPTPWEHEQLNNTIWEPVDATSSNFTYLSLNQSIVLSVNPKQSDWEFYSELWDTYGDETYTTY